MALIREIQRYEDDDTGDTGECETPDNPKEGIDRLTEFCSTLTSFIEVGTDEEYDPEREKYPPPAEGLSYESRTRLDDLSCECEKEEESYDPHDEDARISKESPGVYRCGVESNNQEKKQRIGEYTRISHRIGEGCRICRDSWCDDAREETHDREECYMQTSNSHREIDIV